MLPGSITTSVIASSDGQTYFNLVDGVIVAAHLTIKSGSGYNNLTDKPDLSIYATNAELSIQSDRISATVESINKIDNTIKTSGWITEAEGNTLFATNKKFDSLTGRVETAESSISQNAYSITQKVSSTDYNGQTIISKVNQTASSYKIEAKNIDLVGAVSFNMLSDYTTVNNRINEKASMSDVTNALSNYVTNSSLNNKLSNYALASTLSDYVQSTTLANTLKIMQQILLLKMWQIRQQQLSLRSWQTP